MTAVRPAIGSPCRSSGGRAVALQQAPRLCEADPVATRAARRPLAGADFNAAAGTEGPIAHPTREPNAHAAPYPLGLLSYPVCDGKQRATDQPPLERAQGQAARVIEGAPVIGLASRGGYQKECHVDANAFWRVVPARRGTSTFPGNGARGPGVAAFKSTAAAPVFTEPVEVWNEPTHRH